MKLNFGIWQETTNITISWKLLNESHNACCCLVHSQPHGNVPCILVQYTYLPFILVTYNKQLPVIVKNLVIVFINNRYYIINKLINALRNTINIFLSSGSPFPLYCTWQDTPHTILPSMYSKIIVKYLRYSYFLQLSRILMLQLDPQEVMWVSFLSIHEDHVNEKFKYWSTWR